ncbi:hypothetical protein [Emticicia sp. 21SJ11W-3]|uniref:hypothetical protein n=1 Tax=Emticicia sp. 21SJ11W-3 TaxID=2916755 RepID=UPI0020A13724|nr:hypothetical protein [Emticicia sp. 21SJ11W-3]UTA66374.1 hypothetical protein MB380_12255 [Emticicia sp. 21SJ11W-3]
MYDSLGFKYSKSIVFSETPEIDQEQGLYLKEYFYYETIDGKKAKLGFPKIIGDGRCLLHIHNINYKGYGLSMFAEDVDEDTQKAILEMFKSIRIMAPK